MRGNERKNRINLPRWFIAPAVVVALAAIGIQTASAQTCTTMRKINVGVAVAPPNVVHTAPFIAKALGFFAKRCIDANIIQFDGGAAGTAVTAVGQGTAISNLPDAAIAQGLKARQIWGLAPRPPQAYVVTAEIKTAADLKGQRLSAAGGVGGFNWLMGREVLRIGRAHGRRRAVHFPGHRRAPARLRRRPDRRRRCCIPRTSIWCRSRSPAPTSSS